MTYGMCFDVSVSVWDLRMHFRGAASFVGLAWQTYSIPAEWTVGDQLLRHTLGVVSCLPGALGEFDGSRVYLQILIGLHMWTAAECYNVLGVFGERAFSVVSCHTNVQTASPVDQAGSLVISSLKIIHLLLNIQGSTGEQLFFSHTITSCP